jgi:hypothetical protein
MQTERIGRHGNCIEKRGRVVQRERLPKHLCYLAFVSSCCS